jgi:maleylpyruvate isomerase
MDEVSPYLGRIQEATGRLLATAAALTDAQAREPSLLPGWTRGHVLTHIARNADGMVNLPRGVPERGAGRPR